MILQCGMLLSGCGAGGAVLGDYDLPPEAQEIEGDWPRLVDAPFAPEPGVADPDAPDPATGREIAQTLGADAAAAAVQAETLAAPVVSPGTARRLAAQSR